MAKKDAPTHSWLMERRYFSLIIVVAFVILSIATFYINYRHHTSTTEQALKEDRSGANLLSLVLDEYLKKIVGVMESYGKRLSLIQAIKDKNVEEAMVHLVNLVESNTDIDILTLADKQGTLWTTYPERLEVIGKNFAHREWYKDVSKEWKTSISDTVLGVVAENDLAIQISVPIFDKKGEVIGILVNTQRTVVLSNLIKKMPLDPGQNVTVTDRKGQIIYSDQYEVEKRIRPYPFYTAIKEAMASNKKPFAVDDPELGGGGRYISFAPLGDIGWTVFMGLDKRGIFLSESTYYIQATAIAFLLFLAIALFLVYSRKQLIAQQVQEQLRAERIIRAGDEALRENQARLKLALRSASMGVWCWDIIDNKRYFDDQICQLMGINPATFTGTAEEFFGALHPDDREMIKAALTQTKEQNVLYKLEYRTVWPNGSVHYIATRGRLVRDDKGQPLRINGIIWDITERKEAEKKLEDTLESLRKAVGTTIQVLAYTVETRDPYTAGHQTRSADLARSIATEMGLPQEKIDAIRIAGSIHDIGKLSIPAEILSKPTKLSEIEFALIKEHSRKGYEMLKDVESPWPLAEIVYQHHERMDGSGYPRNLKGEDICIEARILSVADIVEAMASHRPYRPGLGIDAALNEIEKNRGIIYDNAVADACLRLFREKGFQLAGT